MINWKKYYVMMLACVLGMSTISCSDDDDSNAGKYDPASLATSVFVASDRHENGSGNNLKAVLSAVVNDPDAVVPSVVFLGGDYVGGAPRMKKPTTDSIQNINIDSIKHMKNDSIKLPKMDNPAFSINDLKEEIDSAMGEHKCEQLYTYGSHDIKCEEGYDAFFSGPRDYDGYHIYGLSYAQVIYDAIPDTLYDGIDVNDTHGCCAREATQFFNGWVSSLSDNNPIIIMSHVPLHTQRKDNQGGERWYNAISTAAAKHDILFLFCHNHSVEEHNDSTGEQSRYLLAPGDTINTQGIMVKEGRKLVKDEVYHHNLNFYYGNAGYLKLGYGSLITFRRSKPEDMYDTMTISRYSIIDPTPSTIGDTGKTNPYTITLTKWE